MDFANLLRTPSSQNSPGRPLLHCTREANRKSLYSVQIQENTDQKKPLYLNNFHAVNWLLMFFRIYALKKIHNLPKKTHLLESLFNEAAVVGLSAFKDCTTGVFL